MLSVLLAVAALLVLRLIADLVLSALNRAEVRRHADAPPPAVAAIISGNAAVRGCTTGTPAAIASMT